MVVALAYAGGAAANPMALVIVGAIVAIVLLIPAWVFADHDRRELLARGYEPAPSIGWMAAAAPDRVPDRASARGRPDVLSPTSSRQPFSPPWAVDMMRFWKTKNSTATGIDISTAAASFSGSPSGTRATPNGGARQNPSIRKLTTSTAPGGVP